jgi:hypothetical protein
MPDPAAPLDPATFLREHLLPRAGERVAELRAQIAKLERELDERLTAEATVQLVLEGAGAEIHYLNLRGGEMRLSDTPDAPPIMRIYQGREDWEAMARFGLASRVGGPGGTSDLTRTRITRMRDLDGTIEFRVLAADVERRVRVQFGSGEPAEPRCTIAVRAEDAVRMQSGEIAPQMAFMQGLVKLQGDPGFAMQVAAALFL